MQKFAARIVLGLKKFDHISQDLKFLSWPTVEDRLFLNNAVMMFICVKKLSLITSSKNSLCVPIFIPETRDNVIS